MTVSQATGRSGLAEYARVTRSGTYSFLAALPLFVAYEVLILLVNTPGEAAVRVGADVWIKQILALAGATRMFWIGVVVLVVGIGIVLYERKRRLPVRPAWFGWMLFESVLYAVIVAILVSQVISGLFYGMAVQPMALTGQVSESMGLPRMLALSLGAGLYEELVFRVILVTGLAWVLTRAGAKSGRAYAVAALVGALIFSAVHYIGAYGDPFTFASFSFRFLFGLALNGLYLARGFGVAAWTHALYDVMVVTGMLG
jgi:membrane protease YdiL (CAAX protease family)